MCFSTFDESNSKVQKNDLTKKPFFGETSYYFLLASLYMFCLCKSFSLSLCKSLFMFNKIVLASRVIFDCYFLFYFEFTVRQKQMKMKKKTERPAARQLTPNQYERLAS